MLKRKGKVRPAPTPVPEDENESGTLHNPTKLPAEDDPVIEDRTDDSSVPEERERGDHSEDDPVTRERVASEIQP
jgi:hypothetical protein